MNYLERFFPHRSDERVLAEGSVSYLYAPQNMRAVTRLWLNSKFIIAVRDPLELLPSLHQRLICTGDETVRSFDRAWALVPDRMRGRRIPRSCIDSRFLQYEEIGRLGTYVERFFSVVGRENCMVVVFDDLRSRPMDVYRKVLTFLDLPYHARADFVAVRESYGCKAPALQRLLKRPPEATRSLLAGEAFRRRAGPVAADRALSRPIMRWRRRLLDWNRAPAPEVRMSAAVRQQIIDTYTFEVRKLSTLLQRDLSHWLGGAVADVHPRPPPKLNSAFADALAAASQRSLETP